MPKPIRMPRLRGRFDGLAVLSARGLGFDGHDAVRVHKPARPRRTDAAAVAATVMLARITWQYPLYLLRRGRRWAVRKPDDPAARDCNSTVRRLWT